MLVAYWHDVNYLSALLCLWPTDMMWTTLLQYHAFDPLTWHVGYQLVLPMAHWSDGSSILPMTLWHGVNYLKMLSCLQPIVFSQTYLTALSCLWPISQGIIFASCRDCLSYLASAKTVHDLLLPAKTTIQEKWSFAETISVILLPAKTLGRKLNHTDSLCRKLFTKYNSLGRKQEITDGLSGSQIWQTVPAGSIN